MYVRERYFSSIPLKFKDICLFFIFLDTLLNERLYVDIVLTFLTDSKIHISHVCLENRQIMCNVFI